jgi:hypothetical protein
MKALIFSVVMIASGFANAKTVCTLNAANPNLDMEFDRVLYSAEVSGPKYLMYKSGEAAAKEFDFDHLSGEQLKSMDGSVVVTFGPTAEGTIGITIGHIDLSKQKNVLPIDAMVLGEPIGSIGINLISPAIGLSAACKIL